MTDASYHGGCACGAIRYAAEGAPVAELHCQCRHCQMRSGTGHSSYAVFTGPVRITGTATVWRIAGDSGTDKLHGFCPVCGTPTHVTFAANPGVTAVHAGSLDAPDRFRPTLVTYGSRALGWDEVAAGLTVLAKGQGA